MTYLDCIRDRAQRGGIDMRSRRTRDAYREVLSLIIRDGRTVARAFGQCGWVPVEDANPYPDSEALRIAAQCARRGGVPVEISDVEHNGTLFGTAGNLAFRAHHDAVHVLSGADMTLTGEYQAALATLDILGPSNDAAAVILGEVVGQAAFYAHTGSFPLGKHGNQPTFHVTNESVAWAMGLLDFEFAANLASNLEAYCFPEVSE